MPGGGQEVRETFFFGPGECLEARLTKNIPRPSCFFAFLFFFSWRGRCGEISDRPPGSVPHSESRPDVVPTPKLVARKKEEKKPLV